MPNDGRAQERIHELPTGNSVRLLPYSRLNVSSNELKQTASKVLMFVFVSPF